MAKLSENLVQYAHLKNLDLDKIFALESVWPIQIQEVWPGDEANIIT